MILYALPLMISLPMLIIELFRAADETARCLEPKPVIEELTFPSVSRRYLRQSLKAAREADRRCKRRIL